MPIGAFGPEGRRRIPTWPAGSRPPQIAGSALYCTQLPIVNSDRRHGARNFGGESTESSRGLLLRHMHGRRKILAPTGVFPCPSLRVLFWSTRLFDRLVLHAPGCEFAIAVQGWFWKCEEMRASGTAGSEQINAAQPRGWLG